MESQEVTRTRNYLALYLASEDYPSKSIGNLEIISQTTPYPKRAFDILAIKGICIEADDQSLPEGVGDCMDCLDGLDSHGILQAGFKKVIKKL